MRTKSAGKSLMKEERRSKQSWLFALSTSILTARYQGREWRGQDPWSTQVTKVKRSKVPFQICCLSRRQISQNLRNHNWKKTKKRKSKKLKEKSLRNLILHRPCLRWERSRPFKKEIFKRVKCLPILKPTLNYKSTRSYTTKSLVPNKLISFFWTSWDTSTRAIRKW